MSDAKQPHSDDGFNADEFMKLWQEKWVQMLQEKGWPEHMAMPGMGQMNFMMPFMQPFMGGFPGADTGLSNRIAELEKRVMQLEKKLAQRSKTQKRKPAPKT